MSLSNGVGGSSDGSDGGGAGGVIIDGQYPYRYYSIDGQGYGAGGGEKNHNGMIGAVVITPL